MIYKFEAYTTAPTSTPKKNKSKNREFISDKIINYKPESANITNKVNEDKFSYQLGSNQFTVCFVILHFSFFYCKRQLVYLFGNQAKINSLLICLMMMV